MPRKAFSGMVFDKRYHNYQAMVARHGDILLPVLNASDIAGKNGKTASC